MSKPVERIKITMIAVVAALLLVFTSQVAAQDEEPPSCGHPIIGMMVNATDASCQDILDLHAQGVGFGQMMKAWHLTRMLPAYEGTWQELLQDHADGQGWGQVMFAHRFAASLGVDANLTATELLRLKTEEGLGWGQIRRAQAIADAELATFEEAKAWIVAGMEWEEIRAQLGLEDGPPPWSGRPSWAGPPPWAGGPKGGQNGNDG